MPFLILTLGEGQGLRDGSLEGADDKTIKMVNEALVSREMKTKDSKW